MAYEIPQQLEYNEKILFGLTFKQSMYAVIFGLVDFTIFFKLPINSTLKVILIIPPTLLGISFMFLNLEKQVKNFYSWFRFRKAEQDKVKEFFKTTKLTIIKITPNNFAIKTKDEQESVISTFSKFLNSIEFPIQILMKTTKIDLDDYLNKQKNNITPEYQALFEENKKHIKGLIKKNNTRDRLFYLIIPEKDNLDIQTAICEEGLKALNLKYEIIQENIILPKKIINSPNFIKTDSTFNRIIYAHGYPRIVEPAFLDKIISNLGDFDLTIHINPYHIETMMVNLNKELQKQKADLYAMNLKGTTNPSLEIQYKDTKRVLEELQKGNDKLFNISLYINCRAQTETELNFLTRKVQAVLNSVMIIPKVASFQMAKGLKSTLPLGKDELKITRNITSKALATFYPFTSPFLTIDETGIWLGNNKNGIPVIRDIFNLSNPNGLILATSGGGKSFFSKLLISRYLLNKTKVMVIDPQGEYKELVKKFKGQRINLSRTSDTIINPLDLMGHDYAEKRLALMDLMPVMLGVLTEPQKAFIDKALTIAYEEKGINDSPDTWNNEPPILEDLLQVLEAMEKKAITLEKSTIRSLMNRLSMYVDGVFSFLNRKTNIDFNKNFVCFDIGDIPRPAKPTIMFLVLDYVYMKMKTDKERKILLIDEAWSLLSRTEDASYIFEIVKTCRKFNLGLLLINQEVEGLLTSEAGKSVLANSAYTFLMKQKPAVIKQITETFNLSRIERDFLLTAQVGEGILIIDDEHLELKVIASEQEYKVITTKADELVRELNTQPKTKVEVKVKEEGRFYESSKLILPEKKFLIKKGYRERKYKSLFANKTKSYFIKPRSNESEAHCLTTYDIYNYLKDKVDKIELYETVKADIIFWVANKSYGIEIETGKIINKSYRKIQEKVTLLNKSCNEWFFYVTNRQMTSKYNKYGTTLDRRNFLKRIDDICPNLRRGRTALKHKNSKVLSCSVLPQKKSFSQGQKNIGGKQNGRINKTKNRTTK
jgi:conjugal transfer ATP-binding protein TraC